MRPVWTYPAAWILVVVAALVLATATPRQSGVMGRLPGIGQQLGNKPAAFAKGEERILALITFHRDQRKVIESWVTGLKLHQDRSIAWVRMPVVNDPGDPALRAAAEGRLLARYASPQDRSRLLPVFTNREAFVQSAGLRDAGQAYVLVINREGEVLARVAGEFDAGKAETLRQTLLMREL